MYPKKSWFGRSCVVDKIQQVISGILGTIYSSEDNNDVSASFYAVKYISANPQEIHTPTFISVMRTETNRWEISENFLFGCLTAENERRWDLFAYHSQPRRGDHTIDISHLVKIISPTTLK